MKRALITGITGMDGSHMADFLLERDIKYLVWRDVHLHLIERTQNI